MKKSFLFIIGLLVVSNFITSFSLNPKKSKKEPSTDYYVSVTPYQRLLFGTKLPPSIYSSIDWDPNLPPYFKRLSSWTASPVPFTPTTDFTKYIGSISFEEDILNNGGGDGTITLQEALDALYDYYIDNHELTSPIPVDIYTNIYVQPATNAH